MKFTISKQVFLDGLRQVASVVSSKTTLPILSNVKIEAENGQIRFTATDLDVCITGVVPANVLREGTVTLPASSANFLKPKSRWMSTNATRLLWNAAAPSLN